MIYLGILFLVLVPVLLWLRTRTQDRLLEIRATATSTVAEALELQQAVHAEIGPGGFRRQMEFKGKVRCDAPITSELSGTSCVHYTMRVEERYEEHYTETDAQGKTQHRTRTSTTTVASNSQSTRFHLDDGTGMLRVDPEGSRIDARKVMDQYEPYTGGGGSLRVGSFTLQLGGMQSGARRILGYHYHESVLPLDEELYALGEVDDSSGEAMLKSPAEKGKPFILSMKSEEELTKEGTRTAAFMLYGAIASAILGVALVLFGL